MFEMPLWIALYGAEFERKSKERMLTLHVRVTHFKNALCLCSLGPTFLCELIWAFLI